MRRLSVYSDVETNLDAILKLSEDIDWIPAPVGYKNPAGIVESKVDSSYRDAHLKPLKFLQQELFPQLENYVKNYTDERLSLKTFALVKYTEGQFFKEHYDGEGDRKLSIVIYLNDDYEGGEIYFRNQGLTIKPTKNSLVMFPPTENYLHESKPITSGTKYIIVSFWG